MKKITKTIHWLLTVLAFAIGTWATPEVRDVIDPPDPVVLNTMAPATYPWHIQVVYQNPSSKDLVSWNYLVYEPERPDSLYVAEYLNHYFKDPDYQMHSFEVGIGLVKLQQ